VIAAIKRPVAACLACVVGFVVVFLVSRTEVIERLDAKVLNRFGDQGAPSLHAAATFVAHLADPLPQAVLLALACLIAWHSERSRYAIAAIALVAGANLTTQVLKTILAQSRYQPILGYRQVGTEAFPSGHATAAMSMALVFMLVVPRSWRPLTTTIGVCLVTAVGCAVVILHRHYPSDVIGGWLVAGGWCFAVVAGLRGIALLHSDRGTQMTE
jgi:membrane-associated phospholipid phosphatase